MAPDADAAAQAVHVIAVVQLDDRAAGSAQCHHRFHVANAEEIGLAGRVRYGRRGLAAQLDLDAGSLWRLAGRADNEHHRTQPHYHCERSKLRRRYARRNDGSFKNRPTWSTKTCGCSSSGWCPASPIAANCAPGISAL